MRQVSKRNPGAQANATGAGTYDAGPRLGEDTRSTTKGKGMSALQVLRATRLMHRWGLSFAQASTVAGLAYGGD